MPLIKDIGWHDAVLFAVNFLYVFHYRDWYCHVDADTRPVPIECDTSLFAIVFLQIYLATTSTDGKCRVFSTFIKGVDKRWYTLVLHLLGI